MPMWLLILKSSIRCLHWQIVLFLELPFKGKIDCVFCNIFSITAVSQNPPRTLGVTCLSPGRLSKTSHSLLHSNEITSDVSTKCRHHVEMTVPLFPYGLGCGVTRFWVTRRDYRSLPEALGAGCIWGNSTIYLQHCFMCAFACRDDVSWQGQVSTTHHHLAGHPLLSRSHWV